MDNFESLTKIEKLLMAMLALMIENRRDVSKDGGTDRKSLEVLFSEIGLSTSEISRLLGKNLSAVQKSIQRGRKKNEKR